MNYFESGMYVKVLSFLVNLVALSMTYDPLHTMARHVNARYYLFCTARISCITIDKKPDVGKAVMK